MRHVNKSTATILHTLINLCSRKTGHKKLADSEAFMPVVIERIGSCNCNLGDLFSIAHYGVQNGDAMRDPDMVFVLGTDNNFYPVSFRNDYLGVYQEAVLFNENGQVASYRPKLQRDLCIFTSMWMKNIKLQQSL